LKRLDCCVCALPSAKNNNIQDRGRTDILLDLAGVANIATGQPMPRPEITSEWLVGQNPYLIVKVVSATFIKNGYGVDDVQAIDAFRNMDPQAIRRIGTVIMTESFFDRDTDRDSD
jgi:hypothetical protein